MEVKGSKDSGVLGKDDIFDSRETICGVDEEFFKGIHLMENDLVYFKNKLYSHA